MTRVGIIGLGYWGPNLAKSMHLAEGQVAWLCDLNSARLEPLKTLYPDARTTGSPDDILKDGSVDAVVISTPVSSHYDLCRKALQAGKHVLVEKPICDSSLKTAELIRLAHHLNKQLMVGHVFEYNAAVEALSRHIKSDGLGQLYYLDFERTNLGPVRTDVNALWDLATHDISMMCLFMDSAPVRVSACGGIFLNENAHDVAFATFFFESGSIAHLHASWINPRKVRRVTLVGSRKMAVFDDMNLTQPVEIYDKHVETLPSASARPIDDYHAYKTACVSGPMSLLPVVSNSPLTAECAHFIECIRENRRPRSDGYNGYRVICCLEAAMESMRLNGKSVDITILSRDGLLA